VLQVELVSPEKVVYTGEATFVRVRTVGDGEIAFLTGHAPFIGALDISTFKIVTSSGEEVFGAVHGGFVEVSDDRVTILSDVAELADDIDVARAEQSRTAASEILRTDPEHQEALDALRRAEVRVELATAMGATPARH
jgi:F-type H+-transporting ATPase subunit epsilon